MKKENLNNEMESQEFSQMVKEVVMNATQEDNYLVYVTPQSSNYGDFATNISGTVAGMLSKEGFCAHGIEEKDDDENRICFQYYSKDGIEIYNIIQDNMDHCTTEFRYAFKGREDLIDEYCYTVDCAVESIMEESYDF